MKKQQLQWVEDQLDNISDVELVELYNKYAEENHYERVYDNYQGILDELFSSPTDCNDSVADSYRGSDDYCQFNGLAHLESGSASEFVGTSEICKWVYENALEQLKRYSYDDFDDDMKEAFREYCEELGVESESLEEFVENEFDCDKDFQRQLSTHLKDINRSIKNN